MRMSFPKPALKLSLRKTDAVFLAVFGLFWLGTFAYFFDLSVLNPTNIGWISEGDLRQHYLGWVAFRQEDSIGSPVGMSSLLAYPLGAPISSTDSNPLVSLILWPLSDYLPEDFQFIGPWYLLSLGLGLLFAFKLFRAFSLDRWSALCLGAVLAFQPVLFWRYGHDTLTAQWLVLAAFYVVVGVERASRAVIAHGVLLALSMAIHPYLFIMLNFIVGFDILARVWRQGGLRFGILERSALLLVLTEAAALFAGAKLGVFSLSNPYTNEVGVFSTDPLGFFNPFDAGRALPQLPAGEGQYEGFSYLGLGGIAVLVAVALLGLRGRLEAQNWRKMLPVLLAAIIAFAFAILPRVQVLGEVVFELDLSQDSPVHALFAKLRSSGRFVWITVYAIALVSLLALPRRNLTYLRAGALAVLALQFWDLGPLRDRIREDTAYRAPQDSIFMTPEWQERIARADYIYMSRGLGLDFSLDVGAAAFPLKTPLSWFYTAQGLGMPQQIAAEEQLRMQVLNGGHTQNALYLLDDATELPLVHRNGIGVVTSIPVEDFHVVETTAYAEAQTFAPDETSLKAMLNWCEVDCTAMVVSRQGGAEYLAVADLADLTQRGSGLIGAEELGGFATVLQNGRVIAEELSSKAQTAQVNAVVGDSAVSLLGHDGSVQDPVSISYEGVNYARNRAGISLLMAKDDGRLVSAHFDQVHEHGAHDLPMIAQALDTGEVIPDAQRAQEELLLASVQGPVSGAEPFLNLGRVLTRESSLKDVMSGCRQGCTMAISVKDEATTSLPVNVRRLAAQMGLKLAELDFRDGYSAIVENGIVLVQGLSHDKPVDVAEVVSDRQIRVISAGFDAGSRSSIIVEGEDLSINERGINIVALFNDGETISYHFDTHGGL